MELLNNTNNNKRKKKWMIEDKKDLYFCYCEAIAKTFAMPVMRRKVS